MGVLGGGVVVAISLKFSTKSAKSLISLKIFNEIGDNVFFWVRLATPRPFATSGIRTADLLALVLVRLVRRRRLTGGRRQETSRLDPKSNEREVGTQAQGHPQTPSSTPR